MTTDKIFQENLQLLIEKHPKFWFFQPQFLENNRSENNTLENNLLNLQNNNVENNNGEQKKNEKFSKQPFSQIFSAWREKLDLSSVETLCVYGLGEVEYFFSLETWLEEKKERQLIIIANQLSEFFSFLQNPLSEKVLKHVRVHLYLQQKNTILEIAQKFSSSKMEIFLSPQYFEKKRAFSSFRLKLVREKMKREAIFSDKLLFHRHFENFFPNWHRVKDSFYANLLQDQFSNIPAIICGAGPSLFQEKQCFSSLENKALIFAGGSAIAALTSQGIFPHLGVVLDPNKEEYVRLKNSFCLEMPIFYATRVQRDVFSTCNGPFGFMKTTSGSLTDLWMEEECFLKEPFIGSDLDSNSLSVVSMMTSLAVFLGCNPIIFCGVDLAYTNQLCYAEGVVENNKELFYKTTATAFSAEKKLKRKNQQGKMTPTAIKWLLESVGLKTLITKHPDVKFFNVTQEGLKIEGTQETSLEKKEKEFVLQQDLRGFVSAKIQQSQFPIEIFQNVQKNFKKLEESFFCCQKYIATIVREAEEKKSFETGASILAQIEIKEEIAFLFVFQELDTVLDNLLEKKHGKKDFSFFFEKWVFLQKAVKEYLKVFS